MPLSTCAVIVSVSPAASPMSILPPAVMLPVAVISPVILILPVPIILFPPSVKSPPKEAAPSSDKVFGPISIPPAVVLSPIYNLLSKEIKDSKYGVLLKEIEN